MFCTGPDIAKKQTKKNQKKNHRITKNRGGFLYETGYVLPQQKKKKNLYSCLDQPVKADGAHLEPGSALRFPPSKKAVFPGHR